MNRGTITIIILIIVIALLCRFFYATTPAPIGVVATPAPIVVVATSDPLATPNVIIVTATPNVIIVTSTATPLITATPTLQSENTRVPFIITNTTIPTITPTFTLTPIPTLIPTFTFTPIPPTIEPRAAITAALNTIILGDFTVEETNVPALVITYKMMGILSPDVSFTNNQIVQTTCAIRATGLYPTYNLLFNAQIDVVDAFGNGSVADGLTVLLLPDIIGKINCDSPYSVNLKAIAETYDLSTLLK